MIQYQNRLNGIDDNVRRYIEQLAFATSEQMKRDILISEGYRTAEVQQAYYAQGRQSLADVNELRRKAGLYEITEKQNYVISWALPCESPHQHYAAVDVYVLTADGKKLESDPNTLKKFYDLMKETQALPHFKDTIELGLFWDKYGQLDPPHVERKNWRTVYKDSITNCKNGVLATPQDATQETPTKKKTGLKAFGVIFMIILLIEFADYLFKKYGK